MIITVTTEIKIKIGDQEFKLNKEQAEELLNKLIYQIIPSTEESPELVNEALRKLFWR